MGFDSTGVVSCMLTADWVQNQLFVLVLRQVQRSTVEAPVVFCVVGQRTAGAAGQCDSLTLCHHRRRSDRHLQT